MHAGLKRPAIATVFPTARKPVVVLDSGANVDCGADELVQFARLGVVYAEDLLGRDNPAVGLLSIGEEPEKGNAVTKEAHQLLESAGLNFIGNVEGRDLPNGQCDRGPIDVVVCDGFVGNVVLKFYEAIAPFIIGLLAKSGMDQANMMTRAQAARLLRARRRAAPRRERREHHLAWQIVAARDQERGEGRRPRRRHENGRTHRPSA